MNIEKTILARKHKLFAVLVDPDKYDRHKLSKVLTAAAESRTDFILVGGSLLTHDRLGETIALIREMAGPPIILFPGSIMQIHSGADAILLLSLISGRNPDLLIGKHVEAAPFLKKSRLEILPTGYMLIESGTMTTAQYISNTPPIPRVKEDIAACTAMAGEMLGLRLIYMDAGSGADMPILPAMIKKVKESISVPLIVGGGIKTAGQALESCQAGADMIVVGNAIENKPSCLNEIADAVHNA
jgi:putative glycerol-1-phosphate prenyltransferase